MTIVPQITSDIDVLILDDDHDFLNLVCKYLNANKIKTYGTTDSTELIEILKTHNINVLITDVKMPDINGLELIGRIREFNKDTMIIVWTGFGSVEDAVQCIRLGAYDYLEKTDDLQKVVLKVKHALSHRLLSKKVDELSWLNELSTQITSFTNLADLLDFILMKSLELMNCTTGSIFLLDESSDELVVRAAAGPMSEKLLNTRQHINEGVAGYVSRKREPLLVEDISGDARFKRKTNKRYSSNSFICAPLINSNIMIGTINMTNKVDNTPFTQVDLQLLNIITYHCASEINKLLLNEKIIAFNIDLENRVQKATESLTKANYQLQEFIKFTNTVIGSITLGIAVYYNKDYNIILSNPAFNTVINPKNENPLSILYLPLIMEQETWEKCIAKISQQSAVVQLDNVKLCKDQVSDLLFSIIYSPLKDSDGCVIGGILTFEDMTDRLRLQEKILASEKLAVIGRLAANVAHELNNPLDGVMRYTKMTLSRLKPAEFGHQYLTECIKGLQRMTKIVSSLLEFSRKSQRPTEETNLNKILSNVLATLEHIRQERHIEVSYDVAPNIPELNLSDIHYLFSNFIKNAFDAMKSGGKLTIKVSLENDHILIEFKDTGQGMPEEVQKNIFKPLYTTKEAGEGTGLGLAICHEIINKYKGNISFQSKLGKGTCFMIQLPLTTLALTKE
ncbi:MAG: ATP-binding protein [Chlamydiota bacterium]|nr:ATP-binding protein [Chlamydiota bacterium]